MFCSAIDDGPDIGPDRVDLLGLEDSAPGRHLCLAVERRLEETVPIPRAEPPQIEGHAAAGVAQLLTMTGRAVVAVNHRARPDLCGIRMGRRRGRDEREHHACDKGRVRHSHSGVRLSPDHCTEAQLADAARCGPENSSNSLNVYTAP